MYVSIEFLCYRSWLYCNNFVYFVCSISFFSWKKSAILKNWHSRNILINNLTNDLFDWSKVFVLWKVYLYWYCIIYLCYHFWGWKHDYVLEQNCATGMVLLLYFYALKRSFRYILEWSTHYVGLISKCFN